MAQIAGERSCSLGGSCKCSAARFRVAVAVMVGFVAMRGKVVIGNEQVQVEKSCTRFDVFAKKRCIVFVFLGQVTPPLLHCPQWT